MSNSNSIDHYFHLKYVSLQDFEKWRRTDLWMIHVEIVIIIGRDCGSAEWINKERKKSISIDFVLNFFFVSIHVISTLVTLAISSHQF